MKLLHIIPALGPGGPTRALLMLIKEASHSHPGVTHRIACLLPGEYLPLLFQLRRQGAEILRGASFEDIAEAVLRADVVLLHFWNTPSLWRLIADHLPEARYAVWTTVLGTHPPQRLNRVLLSHAAAVITTAPLPADLARQLPRAALVPAPADPSRLGQRAAQPHSGFNVDYVGTTNRGKMHHGFVQMMSRVAIPEVRVRICGGALEPAMDRAIAAAPDPDRFQRLGFVEDIASVLQTSDVFAYPLAERSYATSDLSLQEAMLAGVPPVIFPHGGPARFVRDGIDGIVARGEDEFVAAIEHLHRHPDKRMAMGRAAALKAQELFRPGPTVEMLMRVIESAASCPPARLWPRAAPASGRPASMLFLISQDWTEEEAEIALQDWATGRSDALLRYAEELGDDAFQIEGGILHWRNHAMDDPLLRSWTAGWLRRQGRIGEAEDEWDEASRLGAPATSRMSVSR